MLDDTHGITSPIVSLPCLQEIRVNAGVVLGAGWPTGSIPPSRLMWPRPSHGLPSTPAASPEFANVVEEPLGIDWEPGPKAPSNSCHSASHGSPDSQFIRLVDLQRLLSSAAVSTVHVSCRSFLGKEREIWARAAPLDLLGQLLGDEVRGARTLRLQRDARMRSNPARARQRGGVVSLRSGVE